MVRIIVLNNTLHYIFGSFCLHNRGRTPAFSLFLCEFFGDNFVLYTGQRTQINLITKNQLSVDSLPYMLRNVSLLSQVPSVSNILTN